MSTSKEYLAHALHNEEVCKYLELKPEFADWIITSAFYSSLHFVSHKIFPFTVPQIGGKTTKIESIDAYSRYVNKSHVSKHEHLSDLVSRNCNKISEDYDWLLSMSMNARYSSYQQDILIAKKAISLMATIKKFCI